MSKMSQDTRIEDIARAYADEHARKARHRVLPPDLFPRNMDEAYAVQQALVDLWRHGARGPVGGYKIALTSKAMQEMVGVDSPCGGAIFARDILASPARLSLARFQRLGLEFELCFQVGRALPAGPSPYTARSVREAVSAAVPAFELIEDRNADYAHLDARDLVADNAWCGGIVLGSAEGDWRALDLADTPVTLQHNHDTEQANTAAALGNPLTALAWVANHQARLGHPLQAGHWVMTGSTMKTRFPVAGDHVRYTVQGLGSVAVSIEA
jgi:2-keto-4-pentenoate hydratase